MQRKVQNFQVPLLFILSPEEVVSSEPPNPCFIHAPRSSYLPAIAENIIHLFRQHTLEYDNDPWFEIGDDILLHITTPVGVFYDCYVKHRTLKPLVIRICFKSLTTVVFSTSSATVTQSERSFFHNLKQAVHLLHGNTSVFNDLSIENQRKLWTNTSCVSKGNCENIILASLIPLDNAVIFLPIRILRVGCISIVYQKPVTAQITLFSALQEFFPTSLWFVNKSTDSIANIQCLSNGLVLPLDVPMYELWKIFHSMDMFMYIVITTEM